MKVKTLKAENVERVVLEEMEVRWTEQGCSGQA